MKIVSKYKDFYDSFGFILGKPDESVTYVRIPVYIDPKEEPEYNGVIKELNEYTYSETTGYNKDPYVAYLNTVVVGIYPYIYLCPFYIIVQRRTKGMICNHTLFDIKPITMSEDDVKNDTEHIYEKVHAKFNEYKKENGISGTLYVHKLTQQNWTYYRWNNYDIKTSPWKIENRDIFRKIGSPTFVYTNVRDSISSFMGEAGGLVLDPIFVKLPFDVLGASRETIINNQNIYIDIENFLWENKQEPISNPDNNTRILAAGFDLKTSFRNVK